MLRNLLTRADTAVHDGVHPEDRAYYGRNVSRAYIEDQLATWNNLPPREVRHCNHCGNEVRWVRETPGFSRRTGRPGHSYHLKCVNAGRGHWHTSDGQLLYQYAPPVQGMNGRYEGVERVADDDPRLTDSWYDMGLGPMWGMRHSMCQHYDSGQYKWIEGDRDSYANDELP